VALTRAATVEDKEKEEEEEDGISRHWPYWKKSKVSLILSLSPSLSPSPSLS